jgi:hypothetical protein
LFVFIMGQRKSSTAFKIEGFERRFALERKEMNVLLCWSAVMRVILGFDFDSRALDGKTLK